MHHQQVLSPDVPICSSFTCLWPHVFLSDNAVNIYDPSRMKHTHTPVHLFTPQSVRSYLPLSVDRQMANQLITDITTSPFCELSAGHRPRAKPVFQTSCRIIGTPMQTSPRAVNSQSRPRGRNKSVRDWIPNAKHLWKERTSLTQHCKYCRLIAG